MSRRETALVCATVVLAMLVLWWAAGLPSGWVAWVVRIAAVAAIPAVFFGVIAAQIIRHDRHRESGLSPDQVTARRRRAKARVLSDVAPLVSHPDRLIRPFRDRRPPP